VIKANAHKYSVSAMCRVLQVNRSTYYYEAKQTPDDSELSSEITEIFKASRSNYGTRKIKKELMKTGKQVSRRRIGRIMKQEGLVSNYTTAQRHLQRIQNRKCSGPSVPRQGIQGCCNKRFNICKGRDRLELHMYTCGPL